MNNRNREGLQREPLWYKSGVIYEVHVRSFHDGDGDGAGDFKGMMEKLDYLKDLGITAVWLLPFYPSPLKDDGYDIADYCEVHPQYGTLRDFSVFLREAHRRGLRVITELVLNHTSDQHKWFQRARRAAPGSAWRNFYVWSDTPEKYEEARVIFKDVETSNWTWDEVAGAYYWHRFFSHQPDLNYDNPEVHEAMTRVVDFWLGLGVDGLRLDAVPYLYEQDGTNCENLPPTHAFLKKLRAHVDEKYEDRMLLAEANQWPEEAVAYFGEGRGDECHMAYHFPLMPRLFMAVRMEDRTPIVDILEQTPATFGRRGSTWGSGGGWPRSWATTANASSCSMACSFPCPERRCYITGTKSAWGTTSTSATAMACALRCSGAPTVTQAFPAPILSGSTCRSPLIRNIITRR